MAIKLIAVGEIRTKKGKKDVVIAPGQPFDADSEEQAKSLLKSGHARRPGDMSAVPSETEDSPEDDVDASTGDGL